MWPNNGIYNNRQEKLVILFLTNPEINPTQKYQKAFINAK